MPAHRDSIRRPSRRDGAVRRDGAARALRAGALATGVLIAAAVLSACAPAAPAPSPTSTAAAPSSSTPSPSTPASGPVLVTDGTAADNLPLFAAVMAQVWATPEQAQGRAYIDGLVAVGFDRAAMQVTEDMTTVANPAESIQFSVKWGEQCLVGQVGPATGEPLALVMDALPSGGCLIGQTRAIDW